MTAWDMWFDLCESEMEARGARGIRLDELACATDEAFERGKRRRVVSVARKVERVPELEPPEGTT